MNVFKKTAAALLAAACLAGAVIPTVSSAAAEATYDPCDVNHDGSVDLIDAIVINKYLVGETTTIKYAQLDANRNLIVDDVDSLYVLNKVTNISCKSTFWSKREKKEYPFPAESSTISYPEENEIVRSYMVYDYINKGTPTLYYLYLPNLDALSAADVSPYSIIGPDDRTLTEGPECTGIVYIEGGGTGFVVSDHVIACAAHSILENTTPNEFKDSLDIYTCNDKGIRTSTKLTPLEAHVPFKSFSQHNQDYDYALIIVKEDLSDCTHFSLAPTYNTSAANFANIPIYVTGFSKDESHVSFDEGRLTSSTNTKLYYNTDTEHGDSGAPVYTVTKTVTGNGKTSYTYSVMAIQAFGDNDQIANSGDRINKYHLQFYLNNPEVKKVVNKLT